jgi:hypothetical protein
MRRDKLTLDAIREKKKELQQERRNEQLEVVIVLEKLKISSKRSITNILTNPELVQRIVNEDPIDVVEAIKKYEITKGFIYILVGEGLISLFYNSENQGSKRYIFENEIAPFLPFYYKSQRFGLDKLLKVAHFLLEIHKKNLKPLEYEIYRRAINGENLDAIADKYNFTRARVNQIYTQAERRLGFVVGRLPDYNTLKVKLEIAKMEYSDIKQKIKEIKLRNMKWLEKESYFQEGNDKFKNIKLIDEDFSVRAINCLKAAEIDTLFDLMQFSRKDLKSMRNFGQKSLSEIDEYMQSKNLELKQDTRRN